MDGLVFAVVERVFRAGVGDVAPGVTGPWEAVRWSRIHHAGHFEGRQIGRDHPVEDGDVIELHVR